ncbi:Lecithin-cholesterol acyltransferase-like 1 [Dichanthelium oligosanthes]|uniref:Lecithin-cholesterol acyltransferase-like 1 n=1 Tax=Dichanthelium oligosanthes TaxID=888268 RepID=A0A1E5WAN3_9POAL|nr:Lecithin-cholesterol acyltransferase-like 1 [Dichanthelium oligosanthes]
MERRRPTLALAPAAAVAMMAVLSLSCCGVSAARVVPVSAAGGGGAERHPVILIPGAGGNQLEARLTEDYGPSSLACRVWPIVRGRGGWFRLWFDPSVLLAPLTRCFAERMTLFYDADADDYRNAPGVETRVSDFGSTSTLRYLDPNLKLLTGYMNTLASTLEKAGYEEGHDLFGAPYDFRYGLAGPGHPSQVGTAYLQRLRLLVESACAANGGRPAILMAHSLGGLFALQLLARSPLPWRAANVARLVTLSAPWGGSVQEMLTFASGNTLGVPFVDASLIRDEQRTSESNLWLLPTPKVFGNTTLVVSRHHNRSYSAKNMTQFLRDIGFEEGVEPYRARIRPLVEALPEPGVPVTCLVGTGVDTVESLVYGDGGFDEGPEEVVYGDGDGTVNLASLVAPIKAWSDSPAQVVEVVELPKVSHSGILNDKSALEQIIRIVDSINLNATSYQTSY